MDNERFIALEAHYNAVIPTLATRADIEALRADMYKISNDTHKWMLASMIGMFVGFGGLYYASSSMQKSGQLQAHVPPAAAAQPQTLQPIVIVIPAPPTPQRR